jgi:TatD DNase family protein
VLIDTHCHLTDPAFDADRDDVMARMRAADIGRALVIESRLDAVAATLAWVTDHPALGVATGCHPHDALRWNSDTRELITTAWRSPLVRAAGEIGLDYHYDHAPRAIQQSVFAEQLAAAVTAGLPVVIHAREADEDVVAILREQPGATIVLHSFSSGPILRDAGMAHGWFFSFSGMVTFKSWTQHDTVRAVAADRLLIETDSPYLAPVPLRGRRNEPAFVIEVARAVATIRGTTYDEIAALTAGNASRLFWSEPDARLATQRRAE